MKLLVAYDGSESSDAAIVDLRRAGLPESADAVILTVAEISMQVPVLANGAMVAGTDIFFPATVDAEPSDEDQMNQARKCASKAAGRLRADFPEWTIKTEAWIDSAGSAIIRKAHAWNPDLIVVGSHGRTTIGRFFLGSVSQYVLHHVNTSVRVSRHHLHSQYRPIRLLIGVDGSQHAKAAVRQVAARNWPSDTKVRVIGVLDSNLPIAAATTLEGTVPVAIEDECRTRLVRALREAETELASAGLIATHQLLTGSPGQALVEEAENWAADCVFVGSQGLNGLQRKLYGSVSDFVACGAHCSVEIVRVPSEN
jgi:nucleotide-binding universal stress UspA family protein